MKSEHNGEKINALNIWIISLLNSLRLEAIVINMNDEKSSTIELRRKKQPL
ncbi:MAG TPA: hypothetical protein VEQ18_05415 [Candidatus Nitrosocosmicus sp.]|nr:hypothetical protein [Candidatus Nitrosocosmicus sp.]